MSENIEVRSVENTHGVVNVKILNQQDENLSTHTIEPIQAQSRSDSSLNDRAEITSDRPPHVLSRG